MVQALTHLARPMPEAEIDEREEDTWMGTVQSRDGTTIAFDVWGDGEPLIMIDGATAHRAVNPLH